MKPSETIRSAIALALLFACLRGDLSAQGYDTPLTVQGLHRTTMHSAASRGAGGTLFGVTQDIGLMFANPASLIATEGIQISVGGLRQVTRTRQEQRYGGLQTHSAFGLLMEGLTNQLSDPDTVLTTQADSVQRPFDAIGPSWSRNADHNLPLELLVAVPFTIGDMKVVAGVGAVEYANLNWYYGNNNCLSPSVLSVLDSTIRTGTLNTNPYLVQWYQYYQYRNGSIYGYGASVAAQVTPKLSVGLGGMLLTGETTDLEVRNGRGRLVFFTSSLRLDKPGMTSYTKQGTSEFSGAEFTLSAQYHAKNIDFGFAIKPPTTITRKYSTAFWQDSVAQVQQYNSKVDSVHSITTATLSGEDEMVLPWRGTMGMALRLKDNLTVGIDYEIRSYAAAEYTNAAGGASNPWLSTAILRIGAEYQAADWLKLRAGVSDFGEVLQPLSNALRGEEVSYPVYSLGCGIAFMGATLNVTYEYSDMKFIDTWSNAASITREFKQSVMASVQYEIPW